MPGSTVQIAPVQLSCIHVPKTTEERNFNPLRNWCVECQTACCDQCFETDHKGHDQSNAQVLLINKIRRNYTANHTSIKQVKSKPVRDSLDKEWEHQKAEAKKRGDADVKEPIKLD